MEIKTASHVIQPIKLLFSSNLSVFYVYNFLDVICNIAISVPLLSCILLVGILEYVKLLPFWSIN